MKRFITFGSIARFPVVIEDVQHAARYIGWDKDKEEAIFDRLAPLPKLKVTASEKIHGTNAAVCYSNSDGFWVQSRNNIIGVEDGLTDNANCARTIYGTEKHPGSKAEWIDIITALSLAHDINLDTHIISIFFEWSGGNIQKLSALTGLDKKAIIFQHFKVSPLEPQIGNDGAEKPESARWLETSVIVNMGYNGDSDIGWVENKEKDIFNIMNFPTYEFEIDFNQPLMSQNAMIEIVEKTIEINSPVGAQFECEGNIGEGIVCTFMYKDSMNRFKVKGEKHSASKVKTLKPVDEAREQAKIDFVNNNACKGWRLEQMYAEVFDTLNGGKGDIKQTGKFLSAVIADVIKEEYGVMVELKLEQKQVNGAISKVARTWFMEQLDREAGLYGPELTPDDKVYI